MMRLRIAIGLTWVLTIGLIMLNLWEIQRPCHSHLQSWRDLQDSILADGSNPVHPDIRADIPCPPCAGNQVPVTSAPGAAPDVVDVEVEEPREISQEEEQVKPSEEEAPAQEAPVVAPVVEEVQYKVPNIVHYVWYATMTKKMEYHQMLSIFSAYKVLQPDVIYFHTNMQPYGEYWQRVNRLPTFRVMIRQPPSELYGEKIKDPVFYTSHSNVDRLKILSEYGGIYLDLDVLVTKSFDALRRYECTVGLELPDQVCNSVIVCSKDSPYLLMWLNSFLDDYQVEEWSYNSGKVPYRLSRRFPYLVHIEADTINRPNYKELNQIWGSTLIEWQNKYSVHLWFRVWKTMSPYYKGEDPNDNNIMEMENTFGQIARYIMHGDGSILGHDLTTINTINQQEGITRSMLAADEAMEKVIDKFAKGSDHRDSSELDQRQNSQEKPVTQTSDLLKEIMGEDYLPAGGKKGGGYQEVPVAQIEPPVFAQPNELNQQPDDTKQLHSDPRNTENQRQDQPFEQQRDVINDLSEIKDEDMNEKPGPAGQQDTKEAIDKWAETVNEGQEGKANFNLDDKQDLIPDAKMPEEGHVEKGENGPIDNRLFRPDSAVQDSFVKEGSRQNVIPDDRKDSSEQNAPSVVSNFGQGFKDHMDIAKNIPEVPSKAGARLKQYPNYLTGLTSRGRGRDLPYPNRPLAQEPASDVQQNIVALPRVNALDQNQNMRPLHRSETVNALPKINAEDEQKNQEVLNAQETALKVLHDQRNTLNAYPGFQPKEFVLKPFVVPDAQVPQPHPAIAPLRETQDKEGISQQRQITIAPPDEQQNKALPYINEPIQPAALPKIEDSFEPGKQQMNAPPKILNSMEPVQPIAKPQMPPMIRGTVKDAVNPAVDNVGPVPPGIDAKDTPALPSPQKPQVRPNVQQQYQTSREQHVQVNKAVQNEVRPQLQPQLQPQLYPQQQLQLQPQLQQQLQPVQYQANIIAKEQNAAGNLVPAPVPVAGVPRVNPEPSLQPQQPAGGGEVAGQGGDSHPERVYVAPEPGQGLQQQLDVIPDKAWVLDKGPRLDAYLKHIQAEKIRQEHLHNQLFQQSRSLMGNNGLNPMPLVPDKVVEPLRAEPAEQPDNDNEGDEEEEENEDMQDKEVGVLDPMAKHDNDEEFPDEAKEEEHLHDGQEIKPLEAGIDLDDQINKEAIGGIDTAETY